MDSDTYTRLLKECIQRKSLLDGRRLHSHIIKNGCKRGTFLANHILEMYAMCRSLRDARHMFDKMPQRDEFSWNRMIAGYVQFGHLEDARQLFDKMPERSEVSWNTMIAGYSRHGHAEEAYKIFWQMQRAGIWPNQFTFASVLSACTRSLGEREGKQIHAGVIRSGFESNVFVAGALVDLYAKCENIEDACNLFEKMSERDDGLWSVMIAGYARHGLGEEALNLFSEMLRSGMKPNQFIFSSVLSTCATISATKWSTSLHGYIVKIGLESNLFVGNSLVDVHAKCGSMEDARNVFDKMPEHDEVSWNAMIGAYAQNGDGVEALKFFCRMEWTDITPDHFTLASVLSACASLAALEHGKHIHGNIIKTGFGFDVCVSSALVDMYAKCGSIEDAREVFDDIPEQDTVSWTAMIGGYAQNGCAKDAFKLFELMLGTTSKPNHVTFVGVLSACSHAGLVEEAWYYFNSMVRDHCLTAISEHYACMVDLLGRAGYLEEANKLIDEMPMEPDVVVWGSFLSACRMHVNVKLGKLAAERLFELEPGNDSTYVLLSSIYAAAEMWDDVTKVRIMMKNKGVKKKPGCSWIDVKNRVHVFVTGDRSHPETEKIYAKLEKLVEQIQEAGYVPNRNLVLKDVADMEKEYLLYYHSEKLAIAFGLISTPPGKPIRIIKNLRVCGDCHTAIKFIAKIAGQEIVVRDANRFHHFKDGFCSCGDYW